LLPVGDIGRSHLRVFSDSSFDLLASYQLGSQEIPTAITSMSFGNGSTADKPDAAAAGGAAGSSSEDSPAYYIVGTAVIKQNVSAWHRLQQNQALGVVLFIDPCQMVAFASTNFCNVCLACLLARIILIPCIMEVLFLFSNPCSSLLSCVIIYACRKLSLARATSCCCPTQQAPTASP
jgi:hypothetical protein